MNPKLSGSFHWLAADRMDFSRPVNICDDAQGHLSGHFNVLMTMQEPEPLRKITNKEVIDSRKKYDLILASDPAICRACSNAKLMLYGTTFLNLNNLPIEKVNEVSHLFGTRIMSLEGHCLRKKVWDKEHMITYPHTFWTNPHFPADANHKTLPPHPSGKIDMLYAKYHICIENSRYTNYFTEKLMDCFLARTIPIYWGCPNIDKYFDVDGILIAQDDDDIIRICNSLTDDYYDKHKHGVENNFRLCQPYCLDMEIRLQKIISESI